MKQVLETDRNAGAHISDHAAAGALRRIEAGAREARRALQDDEDERAYLSMLRRAWKPAGEDSDREPDSGAEGRPGSSRLILPRRFRCYNLKLGTRGMLDTMAKRCELCGKGPAVGRNVSHAHNVTRRRSRPTSRRFAPSSGPDQACSCLHELHPVEPNNEGCVAGRHVSRIPITASGAPPAIGPYSQAVRAGDLLFISGQIPLDPETGRMVGGDVAAQTHRVLQSLDAIVRAAGATLDDVVKTTVYLGGHG